LLRSFPTSLICPAAVTGLEWLESGGNCLAAAVDPALDAWAILSPTTGVVVIPTDLEAGDDSLAMEAPLRSAQPGPSAQGKPPQLS